MSDARFEEGAERPLRLRAEAAEDVPVLSAILQDAVLTAGDIAWAPGRRRLALLLSRFRREGRAGALRGPERVRALLVLADVKAVRAAGLDPAARDTVLAILSLAFEPGEDGAGTLRLILAGDGEIAAEVECLDLTLSDVARPHRARGRPDHGV